jgi:hypothetical protein
MVRMLAAIALSLSVQTDAFRLSQQALSSELSSDQHSNAQPTCACSETGIVDGVNTRKPGCAQHFGQRFGYICYVENGESCGGARLSSRTGVYWRNCRAEHLSDEAKQFMQEAMGQLDVENLRTTIGIARQRGVDAETIAVAEARVEQQIEMVAARDELMESLQAFDATRLRTALERSEELELDEYLSDDVMEQAVARFEFLQRRTDSEEALRNAIRDTNLPDLQVKLRTAQTNHVSREAIQLAQARVGVLQGLMSEAVAELNAAMLTRDAGRITEAKNSAQTLHAIDGAVVHQVDERLYHLTRMEDATDALRPAIGGLSLHDLQPKLEAARGLDAYPDVLREGDARVAELTQMNREALQAVERATVGHNAAALMGAIAEAETLDTAGDHPGVISRARARLETLSHKDVARASLEAATRTVDLEGIEARLENAVDLGVDASVLSAARHRISEIAQMRVDARAALERAIGGDDLDVLTTALSEARRLSSTDGGLTGRANDRIAALTRRREAKNALLAATEGRDRPNLESKITTARSLGVDEATLHQASTRSRELEHLMHSAERHLRRDIEGDDYEALSESMEEAASFNGAVTEAQMEQARARLAGLEEIYRRTQALREAFETTSMGHIQNMLRQCREVGCKHDVLEEGEAAAGRLRNRMAHAEGSMIWLTNNADNAGQANELREVIAEVRLLNAAAGFRIEAAENKLRELER